MITSIRSLGPKSDIIPNSSQRLDCNEYNYLLCFITCHLPSPYSGASEPCLESIMKLDTPVGQRLSIASSDHLSSYIVVYLFLEVDVNDLRPHKAHETSI